MMMKINRACFFLFSVMAGLAVFTVALTVGSASTEPVQSGGTFEIKPSVIAGGGGTSTNGTTRIDGTIGQSVLGVSSGGNFSVNGGFWQSQPASTIDISGQVVYCSAAVPPGVPNVTMTLTTGGPGTATTDAMGNYSFASSNPPAGGTYTVTPSKTALPLASQGIDGGDVVALRRHVLSITPLSGCRLSAADSNSDTFVDGGDVVPLRRFVLQFATLTANVGQWRFNPASRTYVSPIANQTNQNYDAFVIGDTTGDVTPTSPTGGSPKAPSSPTVVASVSLPNANVANTVTTFTVPVMTSAIDPADNLVSFQGSFTFDSSVVTFQASPASKAGLTSGAIWSVQGNVTGAGTVKTLNILADSDGTIPLSGSGVLFNLNFTRVSSTIGATTPLTWLGAPQNFVFFDGDLFARHAPTSTPPGSITISGAPSAALLGEFAASTYDKGTYVRWNTGYESHNLGFNVYRDENGTRTMLNPQIIAGSALLAGTETVLKTGRSYGWWDPGAPSKGTVQYFLEDVDLNGQSNWHGPVSAQFVGGTPPSQSDAAVLSGIGNTKASPIANTNVERKASVLGGAVQPAIQFDLAGGPAAKVSVRHEGWYTLSSSQLVAGGLKPNANSDRLQMYVDGVQVPINVTTDDKKQLSAVEFYGVGLDAAYTDARVYWIVEGKENGLRIQQVKGDASPSNDHSFNYSVERSDRTVYFPGLKNGERENFFGAVVGREAVTQSLALQRIDSSATTQAQLEVSLQGVTAIPHRVWVYANGTFAGEIPFNGQELKVASFALPLSLLKEGDNEVRLAAQGGALDLSLIDYIRLSYQHTFTAEGDQLRFTAKSGAAVTIDGFSSAAIRVFDVTNQDQVQQVVGKVEQQKTGYAITVATAEKGDRTLLAIAGQPAGGAPPGVSANVASDLRSNSHGASLLILTNRDFFPAMEALKTMRTSQGYKVEIVDVDDIYDEFSFGDKSPYAVRAFLQYARANWKIAPQYVLLAADASYDPKNYLGFGDWDIVPTKLIDTEFLETASDDWIADFDADGVPEMAVGRLPVRTREEAASMVARIIGYDRSIGTSELTLVADANDGFDFASTIAQLRALVPSDTIVVEIDRGRMGDQAKPALISAINRGQKIVSYTGHGNVDQWRANLLTNTDAGLLTNQNRLALFVMMTCLNGYSDDPALSSLAKALMKSPNGGAVAVWASSGTTMPDEQVLMNQEFFRQLFANRGITLGNAINRAKAAVADRDVRRTWILLGDPTMKVR